MTQDEKRNKKRSRPHHKKPLCRINKPEQPAAQDQHYERIACVFQGGGALGAFQVGAYKAICEHGYEPDYFAGVSIGAINSAIIAGNPRELQMEKLMTFWTTIEPKLWYEPFSDQLRSSDITHHWYNQLGALYAMVYGLDGFFKPRFIQPSSISKDTPDKLSYYDTSPLRATLESLIDFDLINEGKVTLCLGAVNVVTGEMEFFSNERMKLTVDHVMASAALPPGFPAIKIGDDYFWDGGIYANTPLVTVLDALPEKHTLCFVVDCFSLKGQMPQTLDQVEERQKDIRYASHSRRLTNVYTSRQNLQAAIEFLGTKLPESVKKDPQVQEILELGHAKHFSVVHVIYSGTPYTHSFKDYNFVPAAINYRINAGYQDAKKVLDTPIWKKQSRKPLTCSIYGVPSDYFEQH